MKIIILLFIVLLNNAISQELFPVSDAAANISKNRKQVQIYINGNSEESSYYRLNYGLTGNITLQFQQNFKYEKGSQSLGDIDLEGSYRFLSIDSKNEHLRSLMFSHLRIPLGLENKELNHHYYIKPITSLNRSESYVISLGNATTYLIGKLAINFDGGFYKPFGSNLIEYGNYFRGGLSLGYLVFPDSYKSYDDVNLNLYLETKYFNFAKNKMNNVVVNDSGGERLDTYASAQLIFNSEYILEFGYIKSFSNLKMNLNNNSFFASFRFLFF
ncbi:MAG: hypothetical protein IAE65_05180 [Ignavibacteria bacterium]|nr:hypothetical protein [Ignavibacteria bacterium]